MSNFVRTVAVLASISLLAVACGNTPSQTADRPATDQGTTDATSGADAGGDLSGSIEIDGSSTVGPLTDAIAEEYAAEQPDVTVNLSISGTGGGFERFCGAGDTDISNASRPIKDEEAATCADSGISFIEVRVGTDALTMVTNPQTEFVECLTTEEIRRLWAAPGVDTWDQVNPEFPSEPVEIFAPGADSGTYDFFNETVLESEDDQVIADYNASEDDNIIAQGIIGTPNSWGYFGFAYYQGNQDKLQAIAYDAGDGCVMPSVETAQDDSYKLSRPLFIYVKESALQDETHVADFVRFYLDNVNGLITDVGYIPAPEDVIEQAKQKVEDNLTG